VREVDDLAPHAAALVPAYAHSVEQKVEHGSDRVAGVVIEFRARTVMVTGTLKALFLPGLDNRQRPRRPAWQEVPALEAEHGIDNAAAWITTPLASKSIAAPANSGQPVSAENAPRD